jgi:hypothetical protein
MRGLRMVLAVVGVLALTAGAGAQFLTPDMLHSATQDQDRREGGAKPPQEAPTKRANEKDYKSSLDRLPAKKYDPWANAR